MMKQVNAKSKQVCLQYLYRTINIVEKVNYGFAPNEQVMERVN